MKLNYLQLILYYSLLLAVAGCTQVISSRAEMYQWINEPANGLLQSKRVEDLVFTMKYLPPAFLAEKEMRTQENHNLQVYDSLKSRHEGFYTFLLHFQVDDPNEAQAFSRDVMYEGAQSFQHFQQRAMHLNFNMRDFITLNRKGESIQPALSRLENTYSLTNSRHLYLVFDKKQMDLLPDDTAPLDIRFNDELFNTGIHHFVFHPSDLKKVPAISYLQL